MSRYKVEVMATPVKLLCTYISDTTDEYRGEHDINENSECAKETRYIIKSNIRQTQNIIDSDGSCKREEYELFKVHCFDCLIKKYCESENCTNGIRKCRVCGHELNFCFDCNDSGYEQCCTNCIPCSSCFRIHSLAENDFFISSGGGKLDLKQRPCSSCQQLICSEKIHRILDCNNCEAPDIHELKDYFLFLRRQIFELKIDLLETRIISDSAKQTASHAERNLSRLESNLEWRINRGGYYG